MTENYEEAFVDGVYCYRNNKKDMWQQFSLNEVNKKYFELCLKYDRIDIDKIKEFVYGAFGENKRLAELTLKEFGIPVLE